MNIKDQIQTYLETHQNTTDFSQPLIKIGIKLEKYPELTYEIVKRDLEVEFAHAGINVELTEEIWQTGSLSSVLPKTLSSDFYDQLYETTANLTFGKWMSLVGHLSHSQGVYFDRKAAATAYSRLNTK